MAKNTSNTTYLMFLPKNKLRKITVPSTWNVTYGPVSPGGRYDRDGCLALRFYETKDKQRAIFTDVLSFRDEWDTPLGGRALDIRCVGCVISHGHP